MRRRIEGTVAALAVTAAAVAVTMGLFSLFPFLHRYFTENILQIASSRHGQKIVMEYKKPPKKEKRPQERPIRRVTPANRNADASQVQFKFTPDLAVEGTGEVAMAREELEAVVFEEGETDEPAVPLYQPSIPYPDRARELEIEGTLEVIIIIDTQGKVSSIEVVRSPHTSITAAARKVIATWRFKPARNKGVPVRMRVRQVIEFTLE